MFVPAGNQAVDRAALELLAAQLPRPLYFPFTLTVFRNVQPAQPRFLLPTSSVSRSADGVRLRHPLLEGGQPRKFGVGLGLVPVGHGKEIVGAMIRVAVFDRGS